MKKSEILASALRNLMTSVVVQMTDPDPLVVRDATKDIESRMESVARLLAPLFQEDDKP